MAECILSSPHRYDPSLSISGNVFGEQSRSFALLDGSCQSGFIAGVGLSSFVLLAGAVLCALLWRRAPKWSAMLIAGATAYWGMVQLARLGVFLEPSEGREERQFWIEASFSQATFDLVVFALIPLILVGWAVRTSGRSVERFGGNGAKAT